jgi:hypothetical protein
MFVRRNRGSLALTYIPHRGEFCFSPSRFGLMKSAEAGRAGQAP